MLIETLLNILGEADVEVIVFVAQQNVDVIHSPQEIIALYQSAYRQTIASGTGHVSLTKITVWPCTIRFAQVRGRLCHVPEQKFREKFL